MPVCGTTSTETPPPTASAADFTQLLEDNSMFIAIVNNAWYLIVPQGNGKPRAVILGANAISGGTANLPVIKFEWEGSITALKSAVVGI
jgi:murein DD-endopeptidase